MSLYLFTCTDTSQGPQRAGQTLGVTHLLLLSYTLLLCPLHCTCSFIKAFVVYPGMEHADVMLAGSQ